MDQLRTKTDSSKAEQCWKNIKRALHGIGITRKPKNFDSVWMMMPPYVCNLNDMENTREMCYHYKQMESVLFFSFFVIGNICFPLKINYEYVQLSAYKIDNMISKTKFYYKPNIKNTKTKFLNRKTKNNSQKTDIILFFHII